MPRLKLLKQLIDQGSIDDEAALVARYDWETWWARENQIAPKVGNNGGDWSTWLLLAGRGFGKTRTGVEWLNAKARAGVTPLAIVGRTAADVRDVLVEGPAGIVQMSPPWNRPVYEPSKRRVTWMNGVTATTFTAEEPDQLRGPQHAAALCDEIAAWQYFSDAWSNLIFGLRLGDNPQVAALTTPRPLDEIRELLKAPTTAVTRGKTLDNAMNLSKTAVDNMMKRYAGTRLGRQELDGELLDDLAGALWTLAILEAARRRFGGVFALPACPLTDLNLTRDEQTIVFAKEYRDWIAAIKPRFERIVVAVDPSGSKGQTVPDEGDPQGIVVAGKLTGGQERYVVLEDLTVNLRPEEWARVTAEAFERWSADMIVAEVNYGGDMVRAVINAHRASLPVTVVHASRGKHVRAEPISGLYEQEKVAAAQFFVEMEKEMGNFTTAGYMGGASPNRADALVWALNALHFGTVPQPFVL